MKRIKAGDRLLTFLRSVQYFNHLSTPYTRDRIYWIDFIWGSRN